MKGGDSSTKDSSFVVSAALILGLMAGISFGSVARFFYNSISQLETIIPAQESVEID